jgi:hypothetical protein
MPLEGAFSSDSFRNAQQMRSALILLRMSLDCSYAGGLCAVELWFLSNNPAVDLGRRLGISRRDLMLKVETA